VQIKNSTILKAAIFATGFSGIVAEYILSTLATYLLGDSIFQWIMIVSLMLFSMGLGSRISKVFDKNLLRNFLYIEFTLSVLVAFSPLFVFTISAWTQAFGLLIYILAISIGILIGMEIPLVIRINNEYEGLKYNISNILENDYYGSLLGGIFFAFIGLPLLGLTYTPFLLGLVNFLVAMALIAILWNTFDKSDRINLFSRGVIIFILLIIGFFVAQPIMLYGEQKKYADKIVYTHQSKYQRIVITKWKKDYWLYLNGNQQLCTRDEIMYHEPLVHPAMKLHSYPEKILILGGGDGCAAREVLKYHTVEKITLVDLDPKVTELGKSHPILTGLNDNSLTNKKVEIINQDAFKFVQNTTNFFDVILIDLPDPRSVELGRLYSLEFYRICHKLLRDEGILVTQAGSPYFATKAFLCINETLKASGFSTQPIHNQVVTMGEWGWVLAQKKSPYGDLKSALQSLQFNNIETEWMNNESMQLITSFGKNTYLWKQDTIKVNRIHNPVLYKYYIKGNWDLY
jgi:spermidine synthase